ncbi:competence F domain protein [Lysobacter capsici]|nr:competence F domain protein [Lysobacter capsici]
MAAALPGLRRTRAGRPRPVRRLLRGVAAGGIGLCAMRDAVAGRNAGG